MTSIIEDRLLKITRLSRLIFLNNVYKTQTKSEVDKLLSKATPHSLYSTYANQSGTATKENKKPTLTSYNITL